jgi:hypothetical protein
MHKSATKCNETIGKWCKNKHGASKIIDTFETYQSSFSIGFSKCSIGMVGLGILTNYCLDELGISRFDELGISFIGKISSKKVASFDSMIVPTSISGTSDFTIRNLYPMLWKA